MENIQSVINLCLDLMNTPLTFGSFTFTMMQWYMATLIFMITVWFIKNIFS